MNALGLLAVGLVLRTMPELRPGWFPADGWDGSSTGGIWLTAMGTITAVFGFYYLIKTAIVPLFWRWAVLSREKAAEKPARLETMDGAHPVVPPVAVQNARLVA